jgi:pimeloyl-ACP methyl ester carboxylesterase
MKVKRLIPVWPLLAAATVLCSATKIPAAEQQVTGLVARHRAGQTILTWNEVDPPVTDETISAAEVQKIRREQDNRIRVRYRIYRSANPIQSVEDLEPVAEVPPLTCWNADFHGIYPKPDEQALRYVVDEGQTPVPPGTGIYAHNPNQAGDAYYAVTVSVAGRENTSVEGTNRLDTATRESIGPGEPVLQRIERPETFQYIDNPTLHYYVRWESPPNCGVQGKPVDYLVAIPPSLAKPAPVGIHLHCWGGSLNGGYGWWYNAEKGHILIASNQIPYDWWTGYHELYWEGPQEKGRWQEGVVRPYTQRRMLSFLDWVATRWDVDPTRTHVAGSSMGGSGSLMLAIRYPERIAWAVSWVGVHIPAMSPQFKGSYARVYGEPEWSVQFEDGTPVWDHFDDAWYLRKHAEKEISFLTFSNGKNDGGIGWPQAVRFYEALQETRRPHVFVWGQGGHGQRARMPVSLGERVLPIDVRTDQSLPAFTECSLDDEPGNGDPQDGDPEGQVNLYLAWETEDLVDHQTEWAVTVRLIPKAPEDACTVDVTPRRLQHFRVRPGETVRWTSTAPDTGQIVQSGTTSADRWGLITLEKVRVTKSGNRIRVLY